MAESAANMSNGVLWDSIVQQGVPDEWKGKTLFRNIFELGRKDFAYYVLAHGADVSYVDEQGINELVYLDQERIT